jgi:hypothetical protein
MPITLNPNTGSVGTPTFTADGTTAVIMPAGTTAQRPATPAAGMVRLNTTLGYPEWYSSNTSSWLAFGITS